MYLKAKHLRRLLVSLLLTLAASPLWSTWGGKEFTFRHLTTDDGLSQITVNSIYVDERGFVWIGTRDGLCRYNGNDIKAFKQEKNNPNSLFCNSIIRLDGDHDGRVYLLCTEGVAEFNFRTEEFKTLLLGKATSIYYQDGGLYIGQGHRILFFDPATRETTTYYELPDRQADIYCLFKDEKGTLWIGTTNEGVFCLDTKMKELTGHPVKKANITNIYQDSEKGIWIGSWTDGAFWFKDGKMTNFRYEANNPNSLCSDFVRDCCEDSEGYLWIGTFYGLNRYDKRTGQFLRFESDINHPEGLSNSSVWCIKKDAQGTLWMGTYFGGVNYFNPTYEIYTRFEVSNTESQGLSSPIVGRMLEDKDHNFWIATEGGGLNKYDPQTGTFKWYLHQEGRNSISHNNVKALYYDKQHDCLWIGTHLGSLNRLDLRTERFTHYPVREGDPQSLPSDIIRDIIPYKDSLIVATQNGVCLFNPADGKCRQLFKDSSLGRSIKMVASVIIDHEGTLWIAATGEGVFSYRFDTNELVNYRHDPANPASLSNNNVNNITEGRNQDLWFSTSGSGLDRFRYQTQTFENFDQLHNGLASDCVYSVCESRYGKLLVITNRGFSQFDKETRTFHNYTIDDGFPLTAVNENSLYLSSSGEVWLGGVKGLVSFKEKDLQFDPKPYNIIPIRLTVNGKEVRVGDDTGILSTSLCSTDRITLHSQHAVFTIEFALSNFIPANRDDIVYRLEGFSNEWIDTKGRNFITYTNLNPGSYTLVVKGKNSPFAPQTRLNIKVLPPWYKTTAAYLVYALLLAVMLYYLVRTYNARIKLQESLKYEQTHIRDIEMLNQSKLRFFTNISHEFRTPLTLIMGHVEMLLQVQSFTPAVYNRILSVYKNCLQLQDLIGELLDFRKTEQGHMKLKVWRHDLVDFVQEHYLIFKEYATSKHIRLLFEKGVDSLEVWFDAKQFQKVVNNLVSNAIKHTQAGGTITLRIRQEGDEAVFEVADTGTGIAPDEVDKVFERFYQNQKEQVGTGIGLALTKGIVELHHGTIGVSSELGKGSTFTVRLKLGHAHFADEQLIETENADQTFLQQARLALDLKEQDQAGTPALRNGQAKILIVEDNEALKDMLANIFSTFYTVVTAANGQEAWQRVQTEQPDIVLSDVMMPVMSGTELCKLIKENIDTCHIPVVLITARTAIEYNMEGLRLGADDYVTKPFNVNVLISRCNNLVNSRIVLHEKFSQQPQITPQMLATNAMDKAILDKATQIIERYIDNTDFNINVFAREMGIARTNLFVKIKGITGQTPNEFISTIRLKKAAILLRNNPELSISEVSDMVGFSSSRYFSKCFKDQYHISPIAYRKGGAEEEETE